MKKQQPPNPFMLPAFISYFKVPHLFTGRYLSFPELNHNKFVTLNTLTVLSKSKSIFAKEFFLREMLSFASHFQTV